MKKYVADFETSNWDDNETWVWAWCLVEIGNEENIKIGNNIESFIEEIKKEECKIFFHNLKFDAEFIISYLLNNKYKHILNKKKKSSNSFTTLINNFGIFYYMEIDFSVGKKVNTIKLYDSLKIIPLPVEAIPKSFGLDIKKLELDYDREREKGYIIKDYEKEYIKNDCLVVARSLEIMFNEGMNKMTASSNSLSKFKKLIGEKEFKKLFPPLPIELDRDLRKAYKGGFVYVNPLIKDKDLYNVTDLDVNSMYPYIMKTAILPYGEGKLYKGKYVKDINYPLYIQQILCSFELKENKIPTIQIKKNPYFMENEYLKSSNGQLVCLTLTNIDLKLFLEQYNVYEIEYTCGWKFKGMYGMFDEYIDYWIKVKNEATISGNNGMRTLAKLLLNSLYGKFATGMSAKEKYPYLDENDVIRYTISEEKEKDGLYIPVGAFVTSYAREITQRTSQLITDYSLDKYGKDMYYYSDTDSIKCGLSIDELKKLCEIDDVKLGAWKHENVNPLNPKYSFIRAKFIRQKCYLAEHIDSKGEKEISITCAGLPKECYKYVEWETFKEGFTCGGKLTFKHLKGGVKLVETDFTIKRGNGLRGIIKSF